MPSPRRVRPRSDGSLVKELKTRLADTEDALRALHTGEADGVFVPEEIGHRILLRDGAGDSFRVLVEAMNEGAAILQRGLVVYANTRLAGMLRARLETVMGQPVHRLVATEDLPKLHELLVRSDRDNCAAEVTLRGPWRSRLPVRVSLGPMTFHGEHAVCAIFTDLSERERAAERLRDMSTKDELTGLSNRRGFFTLGEQQVKIARRASREILVFFIDLDGLKPINDGLGHGEGDRALADAAVVLRSAFREADVVARIGGDEFAVLAAASPGLAPEAVVERLQLVLEQHNACAGRPYRLAMSVGHVRHDPGSPCDLGELLGRADEAMYAQKRQHQALRHG